MTRSLWLVAALTAALMTGCSSQKEPAEQAVANVDATLSAVHDGAMKYAPDDLKAVEAQVATLKEDLAKGDYQGALAAVPAVNTALGNLKQTVDAKQAAADAALAQTKQQWRTVSADVEPMVAAIQSRVDTLSKSPHLPKGVTKSSFESAKAGLQSLKSTWTDATNAVSNEDYAGAVAKGQAAKDKAAEVMHELGMKSS
jgi:hypothetical protein